MKKLNKKIIFIAIAVVVIGVFVWQIFLKQEKPKFSLVEVVRGEISQEVSETGTVEMGEKINLTFKNSGIIERVYVKVGDKVSAGQSLAKLDADQLQIQLQDAKAALSVAQAKLDKLLAGSNLEEIQLYETLLANAYKDAISYLNYAYLKTNDTFLTVSAIQRSYFYKSDYESLSVSNSLKKTEEIKNQLKSLLESVQANSINEETDRALLIAENSLATIQNELIGIRDIADNPLYRNTVSSTDKTSLDTKISNIETAKSQISTAIGTIKKAKDDLSIKKAPPRQEDVNLYQAQLDQARAEVTLLEDQISDAFLRSPVAGTITEINKRIGETVQAALASSIVSLLPVNPLEIKTDIYEEDVIKIEVGDSTEISFIALPDKIFKGKVASIEPAEKIKEGVVYYEITIIPEDELPQGIKPGMTADLKIKTETRENVLIIPQEAIKEKNGKTIVEVIKNEKITEREVIIGLEGSNDMVVVISGLQEGEKIILP